MATRIGDPEGFGKVAVALGGASSEREVSLDSGGAVLSSLIRSGIDAHPFDPAETGFREFLDAGFDRVWNVLHGPGGEDGVLQGALDWCAIPYTGCGVLASSLAMDKVLSKALFRDAGLATPAWSLVSSDEELNAGAQALGFPLIVKPVSQGSSVGMARVDNAAELSAAFAAAAAIEPRVLLEAWVDGPEYTVSILDGAALPSIRIETPRVFYDYVAKYEADTTCYTCPGLAASEETLYRRLALEAFALLGCTGWGRVDFMCGADSVPQILEVNTVPGMTSHSLVPKAAREIGLDFDQLCWRILETSFDASNSSSMPGGGYGA